MDVAELDDRVNDGLHDYIEVLLQLLSQPSVSSTGEGIDDCISLVEHVSAEYGFDETRVVDTPGHPAIITRAFVNHDAENDKPTLLIYGHYDVQPVEPGNWDSPPFEPAIRRGPDGERRVYARGAGDNKGQWFAHFCAVDTLRETTGLPLNVTILLEGEEETGSEHLRDVVAGQKEILAADLVYNADGPMERKGVPEVNMGTRGLLYLEIEVTGPTSDLHSGNYGGPIPNPAWELVHLLSSMKSPDGVVTVEGFYDDVTEPTKIERRHLSDIRFDEQAALQEVGVSRLDSGPGDTYLEKLIYQPTFSIAGIHGGYGGERAKTIIPSKAAAKLDMRLVEAQDPDDIYEKIVRHVDEHGSESVSVDVTRVGSVKPLRIPLDSSFREPVVQAVADVWDMAPMIKPSAGGAGPYYVFDEVLNLPYIAVPYANKDENNHAPNENLRIDYFERGIQTSLRVFQNLGRYFERTE